MVVWVREPKRSGKDTLGGHKKTRGVSRYPLGNGEKMSDATLAVM